MCFANSGPEAPNNPAPYALDQSHKAVETSVTPQIPKPTTTSEATVDANKRTPPAAQSTGLRLPGMM